MNLIQRILKYIKIWKIKSLFLSNVTQVGNNDFMTATEPKSLSHTYFNLIQISTVYSFHAFISMQISISTPH